MADQGTPGPPFYGRLRWYELIPEAVVAVGLTLFLITETNAATSAFSSLRAIAIMAVVAILWVVMRILLWRFVRWPLARLAPMALAGLGVLAVVVFPAYQDKTVVETFPGGGQAVADVPDDSDPTTPPRSSTPVAGSPEPGSTAVTTTSTTTTTTAPAGPVRTRQGQLAGIGHDATGGVSLYRQPDGHFVVGLEEIDIQPGPDYDVYVVPGSGKEDKDGGIRLDDLRGNRGTQYYEVPAGTDLDQGAWTVLVWCQTFAVPVAAATPA
jgi:hypothetical protein